MLTSCQGGHPSELKQNLTFPPNPICWYWNNIRMIIILKNSVGGFSNVRSSQGFDLTSFWGSGNNNLLKWPVIISGKISLPRKPF
jgi:hypothetical protein